MRDRQTCIDCGRKSPETETNYTLISAQFGWRLSRRRDESGEFVVEWRCPDCWRLHKKKTEDAPAGSSGTRAAFPERAATLPSATRSPYATSPSRPGSAPTSSAPSSIPPSGSPATPRTRRP